MTPQSNFCPECHSVLQPPERARGICRDCEGDPPEDPQYDEWVNYGQDQDNDKDDFDEWVNYVWQDDEWTDDK